MRHKKSGRKLNRNSAHRKALFKNLAIALIEQDIIKTTLPKAKELRSFIEPLITMAKVDNVANRRHVFSKLRSDSAVAKLFSEVSVNAKDRKGGYTRIIKQVLGLVIRQIWHTSSLLIDKLSQKSLWKSQN